MGHHSLECTVRAEVKDLVRDRRKGAKRSPLRPSTQADSRDAQLTELRDARRPGTGEDVDRMAKLRSQPPDFVWASDANREQAVRTGVTIGRQPGNPLYQDLL